MSSIDDYIPSTGGFSTSFDATDGAVENDAPAAFSGLTTVNPDDFPFLTPNATTSFTGAEAVEDWDIQITNTAGEGVVDEPDLDDVQLETAEPSKSQMSVAHHCARWTFGILFGAVCGLTDLAEGAVKGKRESGFLGIFSGMWHEKFATARMAMTFVDDFFGVSPAKIALERRADEMLKDGLLTSSEARDIKNLGVLESNELMKTSTFPPQPVTSIQAKFVQKASVLSYVHSGNSIDEAIRTRNNAIRLANQDAAVSASFDSSLIPEDVLSKFVAQERAADLPAIDMGYDDQVLEDVDDEEDGSETTGHTGDPNDQFGNDANMINSLRQFDVMSVPDPEDVEDAPAPALPNETNTPYQAAYEGSVAHRPHDADDDDDASSSVSQAELEHRQIDDNNDMDVPDVAQAGQPPSELDDVEVDLAPSTLIPNEQEELESLRDMVFKSRGDTPALKTLYRTMFTAAAEAGNTPVSSSGYEKIHSDVGEAIRSISGQKIDTSLWLTLTRISDLSAKAIGQ